MRFLLATNHLGLGGSESYLLTVAEQLDRLAHETVVFAPELSNGVEAALERGLEVADGEGSLEGDFDTIIAQDGGVSYELAERFPATPQVYVAHSEMFDLQAPPQLPGVVSVAIALNDRVERRLRSYATATEVVRLRQPIDTECFTSGPPLAERAARALLLSNTPHADRIGLLEAACAEAGMDLETLGGRSGQSADPRSALIGADVVIGYGRSILEGMACGRAAYVYDWAGGDGWVTRETYPGIEADGIAGRSGRVTIDAERLAADLTAFDPAMGPVNRDLIMGHHRANVHAQELVALAAGLSTPVERPRGRLGEMARLVRLEWRARSEIRTLQEENAHLRHLLIRNDEEKIEALREAEERIEGIVNSATWRWTEPLRALRKALRGR